MRRFAGFNVTKRKGFGKGMFKWAKNTIRNLPHFPHLGIFAQPAKMEKQDVAIIGGGIASLCAAISLGKTWGKSHHLL